MVNEVYKITNNMWKIYVLQIYDAFALSERDDNSVNCRKPSVSGITWLQLMLTLVWFSP